MDQKAKAILPLVLSAVGVALSGVSVLMAYRSSVYSGRSAAASERSAAVAERNAAVAEKNADTSQKALEFQMSQNAVAIVVATIIDSEATEKPTLTFWIRNKGAAVMVSDIGFETSRESSPEGGYISHMLRPKKVLTHGMPVRLQRGDELKVSLAPADIRGLTREDRNSIKSLTITTAAGLGFSYTSADIDVFLNAGVAATEAQPAPTTSPGFTTTSETFLPNRTP